MQKSLFVFCTVWLFLLANSSSGQITGTNPVTVGTTTNYTYDDGNVYTRRNWQITNGTINSTSFSGTSNSCNVTWSSTCGTGTLTFRNLTTVISSLNVTIDALLDTPTDSFTLTEHCQYTTITRNGSPPTGETWYWQTSQYGTSTSESGADYNVTSTGYYYLRSYACGYWSDAVQTPLVHTIIQVPGAPTGTSGSHLGPGSVVISASPGAPGDNIRWYDSATSGTLLYTGTSYTTGDISTTTTYYASSIHAATSCESATRTAVAATINALNQVSTMQLYKEGLDLSSVLDTLSRDKMSKVVSYMDGLGSVFQTISVAGSPDTLDMISATGPEKPGLSRTTYLPYVSDVNNGRYRPLALRGSNTTYAASEQYDFYQSASLIAHDQQPYSKTVYRQTPDARVIEQGSPGKHWQPVTGDTTHSVRSVISFNSVSDSVRKWDNSGITNGYYATNTVVVETTTDENGNQVKSFTNALGQLVLKKVQYDTSKWLKTYYVYDEYGRLKYQVPPRAVGLLDSNPNLESDTNLAELIFKYKYDNKSRVIEKKVPGAEKESIVYDKLDRVVLTQDGNLNHLGKWMFIKYDFYGRPVYSGLYSSGSTRETLQTALDSEDYSQSGVKWYEYEAAGQCDYSNQAFPRSSTIVLSINYYDHYDFDRDSSADYGLDPAHLEGQDTLAVERPRGSVTGSRKRVIDANGDTTSTWLRSVIFYGSYDRVIQTLSNNHLYSVMADKSTVIYDFAGQVLESKTTHTSSATFSVSYVDRPEYDHAGRVLKQYRKINSDAEQLVAAYVYNQLGQVVDKKLHYSEGSYLQSVDYRYNIRGWLTSINNAQLTNDGYLNDDTGDFFGMELAYEKTLTGMGNVAQSNGNISAMKWRNFGSTGAAAQRSYKYSYDKGDRLTESTFQASSNATSWGLEVNTLNESMTYDANGNIKTLVRKQNNRGLSGTTVTSTPQTIDDLSYVYQSLSGGYGNTNTLVRVNDAVSGETGQAGFNNGADSDTEFAYTTWGSVKKDDNKKIDSIVYNFLGKPMKVYFQTGYVVSYSYDAIGSKLSVRTDSSSITKSFSNYVSGFVYEGTSPELSFFGSPEGRIVMNGTDYEYQYAISDHLGNTRVLFTSAEPPLLTLTATFEQDSIDNSNAFNNVSNVVPFGSANHTTNGSKVVRMNQAYPVGPAKSLKVYPGDSVKVEVWTYYEDTEGYSTNNVALATSIAAVFGGSSGAGGESGSIFDGVNSALSNFAAGGSPDDSEPPAYLNYILFDQKYKVLDAGWERIPTSANYSKQKVTLPAKYITEAGFYFTYLSYEGESNNYVYFDDYNVQHVKSRLIQANEYYAFGLQTNNSWTRENERGNQYLANGGTELNEATQLYDLDFRNYDPALGRMYQVDPAASNYASATPFNYSFNNPVTFNDPSGAEPPQQVGQGTFYYNVPYSPGYIGYTYDDRIDMKDYGPMGTYNCAMCWRDDVQGATLFYGITSGSTGSMGEYWHPGDSRLFWSQYETEAREIRMDADRLQNGEITSSQFASNHYSAPTGSILNALVKMGLASQNQDGMLGYWTNENYVKNGTIYVTSTFNRLRSSPQLPIVVLGLDGDIQRFDSGANKIFVNTGNGLVLFHDNLVQNNQMTIDAFSNGLLNILRGTKFKDGRVFDPSLLYKGKISVALQDGKTYNGGVLKRGLLNHTTPMGGGLLRINYSHINGESLTVESIRKSLGIHEFYAHGLLGYPDEETVPKYKQIIKDLVNGYPY